MSTIIKTPTELDDIVFSCPSTEAIVRQFAEYKRHEPIILHGPPGTGKSTTARIITEERAKVTGDPNDAVIIHASEIDESNIENLWQHWNWGRLNSDEHPYVIIEEVDQLSPKLQKRLRGILDQTSIGSVILTTNNIHAIDTPLADRCYDIEMPTIDSDAWRDKIREIVSDNGLTISDRALDGIVETSTGSGRDIIRGVSDYILRHKE